MGISLICFKAFSQLTQFLEYVSDVGRKQKDSRGNYYRLRLKRLNQCNVRTLYPDLKKYSNEAFN